MRHGKHAHITGCLGSGDVLLDTLRSDLHSSQRTGLILAGQMADLKSFRLSQEVLADRGG